MLLAPTELQDMIESSVVEFLKHEYDFIRRTLSLDAPQGISPEAWNSFAEMGWLGLPVAEEEGGIGGGLMECGLLMRAFGQHLVVEPYLHSVMLGTRLLASPGHEELKQNWLADLIAGDRRVILAHEEPNPTSPWAAPHTLARREGDYHVLNGQKTLVLGGAGADAFVVSAVTDQGDTNLFLVERSAPGLSTRDYATLSGTHACDIQLDNVLVSAAHRLAVSKSQLDLVLAEAIVMECWEATGAMQAALHQTAQYTQDRQQFGQSLSKFQVIQHRLAEMAVFCEEASAACQLATLKITQDPDCALHMAAMAKSKVGRGALQVAKDAVQLHGAMGVSEEMIIPSLFRKLLAFTQQYQSTAWFTKQYGEAMFDTAAWRESQVLPRQSR